MQAEAQTLFPQVIDWFMRSGMFGATVGLAWFVIRRLNRDESLRQDFPPHRHVGTNGSSVIVYPKEYEPGETERFGR